MHCVVVWFAMALVASLPTPHYSLFILDALEVDNAQLYRSFQLLVFTLPFFAFVQCPLNIPDSSILYLPLVSTRLMWSFFALRDNVVNHPMCFHSILLRFHVFPQPHLSSSPQLLPPFSLSYSSSPSLSPSFPPLLIFPSPTLSLPPTRSWRLDRVNETWRQDFTSQEKGTGGNLSEPSPAGELIIIYFYYRDGNRMKSVRL